MHSLSFRQKTQAVCLIRLLNHRNNLLKCQGRLKTLSYKTLLLQQLQLGILRLLLTSLRYMQYQPFLFLFILFCFARVRIGLSRARYPRGLLSASFLPLLVLWYYSASSFYSVFLLLCSFSQLLPSLFQLVQFSAVLCLLHYRVLPSLLHIYSSVAFICFPPAIINLLSPLWHIFQHEMFIICFLMADV